MTDAPRDSGWIITSTGRQFWPLDPRPADIDVRDIAMGLAQEPRYGGQTPGGPLSVAEHSVYVSHEAERLARQGYDDYVAHRAGLMGLLHDAAEGMGLKDIPRPVKKKLSEYGPHEERLMQVVWEWAGISDLDLTMLYPFVEQADLAVYVTEREQLWKGCEPGFSLWERSPRREGTGVPGLTIGHVSWSVARQMFLERWKELRWA